MQVGGAYITLQRLQLKLKLTFRELHVHCSHTAVVKALAEEILQSFEPQGDFALSGILLMTHL